MNLKAITGMGWATVLVFAFLLYWTALSIQHCDTAAPQGQDTREDDS